MYLVQGNEAKENTRTVASVNDNTQEKKRDGQGQEDKDITDALACNHSRWIVPTSPSKQ